MKNYLSKLRLTKEARLLDSKLYMIKAFFAIATAYTIAANNSIAKLDIISVLFGLMLTLEPVNFTGVRSGLNQLYASILGVICTAAIIYVGGINIFTIAFSMSFTLYVCLKLSWREVSPVAIFTSIYMTQYIQKTPEGIPSILLTARLRLTALGVGVLIAIVYNFIFSIFSYKKMVYKRILFVLNSIVDNLRSTNNIFSEVDYNLLINLKVNVTNSFINTDWIFSQFKDIEKENKIKFKWTKIKNIKKLQVILLNLKLISHLNYDICYILDEKISNNIGINREEYMTKELSALIEALEKIISIFESRIKIKKITTENVDLFESLREFNDNRINANIVAMEKALNIIVNEMKDI
ncbi:aromatic acid exporter family protein [Desnuesiella massiliensis]|uniref:aromatic acid exporter family protein n=1 Tax=Desnuesiella massiliensis TaxID=1650662 RepID=UPI0006E448D2|nr:aromatic acid exporter family protein [Desnuesiella massiliensis]